jgi:hypothetical protein
MNSKDEKSNGQQDQQGDSVKFDKQRGSRFHR